LLVFFYCTLQARRFKEITVWFWIKTHKSVLLFFLSFWTNILNSRQTCTLNVQAYNLKSRHSQKLAVSIQNTSWPFFTDWLSRQGVLLCRNCLFLLLSHKKVCFMAWIFCSRFVSKKLMVHASLFYLIILSFGVKWSLRVFSLNQLSSVNFNNFEPILLKSSEVILLASGSYRFDKWYIICYHRT